MTMPSLIWGSPQWMTGAWCSWASRRPRSCGATSGRATKRLGQDRRGDLESGSASRPWRSSLLDPLLTGTRPRRGANAFVILADNSQSLRIRDDNARPHSRRMAARRAPAGIALEDTARAGFRRPRLCLRLAPPRSVDGFDALTFDGTGTSLTTSLGALSRRFRGLPLAGVLLFTDGNRTDVGDLDWSALPPIYPVVPPSGGVAKDVGVEPDLDQPDQFRVGSGRDPGRRRCRRIRRASRSSPSSPTRPARKWNASRCSRPETTSRSAFGSSFAPSGKG